MARTGIPSLVFVNGGLDPEFSNIQGLPEGLNIFEESGFIKISVRNIQGYLTTLILE